ncbi:tail fiber assembly protein [Aeromonas bivalvium]|uniref:tail fiber assembly protein n=1 Tax=Aeromonas bivalvium TaxID=440079 RepID=UPI0038D0D7BA
MKIFGYDPLFGCLIYQDQATANPLDQSAPLMPTYSTPTPAPMAGEHECARYLDSQGKVPAHHAEGDWVIHPDWRNTPLWHMTDGHRLSVSEPNITPEQLHATWIPYPGPGHVWRDGLWHADPALLYQFEEQAAEQALTQRLNEAKEIIGRIQAAIEGGYAKQADITALPTWQRYCYELPDVRTQPGWPTEVVWSERPT